MDGRQELCPLLPDATAQVAAERMTEGWMGAVLVDEHGHLLGIVTECDIVISSGRKAAV